MSQSSLTNYCNCICQSATCTDSNNENDNNKPNNSGGVNLKTDAVINIPPPSSSKSAIQSPSLSVCHDFTRQDSLSSSSAYFVPRPIQQHRYDCPRVTYSKKLRFLIKIRHYMLEEEVEIMQRELLECNNIEKILNKWGITRDLLIPELLDEMLSLDEL